jgi:hypothetical protein
MLLRQSEHGSCVAKKMQSCVAERSVEGSAKYSRIQFVSAWSRGDSRVTFTETCNGVRSADLRIAAPNGLLPWGTLRRSRGRTRHSTMFKRVVITEDADDILDLSDVEYKFYFGRVVSTKRRVRQGSLI